jgi:hypothetical protein
VTTPKDMESPLSPTSPTASLLAMRMNNKALDLDKGSLSLCLNHYGISHWPKPPLGKVAPKCALHHWVSDREWQYKEGIMSCSICYVNLCIGCFELFHTECDLIKKKKNILAEMKVHWDSMPRGHSKVSCEQMTPLSSFVYLLVCNKKCLQSISLFDYFDSLFLFAVKSVSRFFAIIS